MTMAIPVASYIDHTLLKPTCRSADISKLCREALNSNLPLFAFRPMLVKHAVEALKGSPVKTATVIGFPMGYSSIDSKLSEINMPYVTGPMNWIL